MPQAQLPFFPNGTTEININLAFEKRDSRITYFNGTLPIFSHDENDRRTFLMIISQFYVNGNATQAELYRAFGIPAITLKRAVKKYREEGTAGFFKTRNKRGATILTSEVLIQAQALFDQGEEVGSAAKTLGIKNNTLNKAVLDGRLHKQKKSATQVLTVLNKSERNAIDHKAPIGMGATNTLDRVAAMVGEISEVALNFKASESVPNAGVLFALPALLSVGLLHNTKKHFQLPNGYYGLASIFLLMAFIALARVKSIEQLRYHCPGEWGKILGLDRIPEVRTLREKLKILSTEGDGSQWGADLCAQWMGADIESAATLYIDGHVRVYHGSQTKLPRHHVSRQRLCLRATTDYWVNAMDGQPFFYINKEVDPGLIKVVENEIVPRLEQEVPGQPGTEKLKENRLIPRFTLVFDREGYSPALMLRLKAKRVACLTYHKYPEDRWPETEFTTQKVSLVTGEKVEMALAERGTWLGNKLWVREIRKLNEGGHQTSIIATHYAMDFIRIAVSMFARWSQENFFRYMRQHYNIDGLVDYCLDDIPDSTPIINPDYRQLDSKIRSINSKLSRRLANFGSMNLESEIEPHKVEPFEQKKAKLLEEITEFQEKLDTLKTSRKVTDKHITIADLPEDARFSKLATHTKQLIDTVKMVAYRAETAMVNILREPMSRVNDARQLMVAIYQSEADILPDHKNKTLNVRLHRLANHSNDRAIELLCKELNETKTIFPGTDFQLIFEFGTKT